MTSRSIPFASWLARWVFRGGPRPRPARGRLGFTVGWVAAMLVGGAQGAEETVAPMREQVIPIREGWNAVFLEVYPTQTRPEDVFAGTPLDIVAAFYDRPSAVQFVSDPGADLFKREGWGVWYAAERPEAVLKTLFAIHGQQAYLVHSKEAFTWRVRGAVVAAEVLWRPDSFNLVGFSVRSESPPTFGEFFAGSPAHAHTRLYRLVNGSWRRVSDPSGELMRSGEAFWIYCDGASTYQGPLRVRTLTRRGVVVGTGESDVTLSNETTHPLRPVVEHVAAVGAPVPLSIVIQIAGDPRAPVRRTAVAKPDGAWIQELPPLEVNRAVRVPLAARREAMERFAQVSLLRIGTDLGTESWVPVIGIREDLEEK